MSLKESRRDFFRTAGSGATVAALGIGSSCSRTSDGSSSNPARQKSWKISREAIESEIKRRADFFLSQRYLVVDYYRIRRQLAYKLPVRSLSLPEVQVPSIGNYPWATWMTWELEERVNSLGWAAEWFGNEAAAQAVAKDLSALAQWPAYRQYEAPDLSSGHAGRILWTALAKWTWLDSDLRSNLQEACHRHFEEILPQSRTTYGNLSSTADIRGLERPYRKLHNIALIGTIAAALTGSRSESADISELNQWIQTLLGANLDFREEGFTEGVAYDGYVLDFVADWMNVISEQQRLPILEHKYFVRFLEESYMLSAPGAAEKVAELGDVEPEEMPFHISAQAKLYPFQPDPVTAWHLRRWKPEWMRAAGLGALHPIVDSLKGKVPADGATNAHYAVVLRNGWELDGLASVVSCCNSPMGHLQKDNGTILIGKAGRWLITDPGYQQYIDGLEREFTLGPSAHNYPVLDDLTQNQKSPRLMTLENSEESLQWTSLDLTHCYPEAAGAKSIVRNVWLSNRDLVIVADQIEATANDTLQYHWHGDPEASWWCQDDGWALIHTDAADLWLTSPQFAISGANIVRLPASRGQLTLSVKTASVAEVVWWIFIVADAPAAFHLAEDEKSLEILGRTFSI